MDLKVAIKDSDAFFVVMLSESNDNGTLGFFECKKDVYDNIWKITKAELKEGYFWDVMHSPIITEECREAYIGYYLSNDTPFNFDYRGIKRIIHNSVNDYCNLTGAQIIDNIPLDLDNLIQSVIDDPDWEEKYGPVGQVEIDPSFVNQVHQIISGIPSMNGSFDIPEDLRIF